MINHRGRKAGTEIHKGIQIDTKLLLVLSPQVFGREK